MERDTRHILTGVEEAEGKVIFSYMRMRKGCNGRQYEGKFEGFFFFEEEMTTGKVAGKGDLIWMQAGISASGSGVNDTITWPAAR